MRWGLRAPGAGIALGDAAASWLEEAEARAGLPRQLGGWRTEESNSRGKLNCKKNRSPERDGDNLCLSCLNVDPAWADEDGSFANCTRREPLLLRPMAIQPDAENEATQCV